MSRTRQPGTGAGRAWDGTLDLRALAETIPGLVFVTDASGANLFVNGRFQAYTGLAPEGLLGGAWLRVVHPEDRDRVAAAWDDAVAAGEPYEIEARLRSADGDHLWHLTRATPVREGGRIVRWVGHCAEIEDQKRAEAARVATLAAAADRSETGRRAAEEMAARLMEATADCILTLSPDGRLLSVNGAGLRAMGLDRADEALGTSWPERWRATGFLVAARRAMDTAALGGVGRFVGLCRPEGGAPHWWDVAVTPVRDATGAVERLLCAARDVTEARETAERVRLIAETVREVFYQTDLATGRALYVSPAYAEVWGRPVGDLHSGALAFLDGVHPEDRSRVLDALDRQRRGESTRRTYRVVRPDGSVRQVRDIASPVFDASGRATQVVGAVEDITGEAEAEARFRTVFQSMFSFIGLLSPEGALLEANDSALAFAGATASEVLGRPFWDAPWWDLDGAARDRLKAMIAEAAAGGFARHEATARVAGGGRAVIDVTIKPVLDAAGRVVELIAEGRDLTASKAAEAAAREGEERLRLALEAVDGVVYDWDLATGRLDRSGRLREIAGFDPEEVPATADWWSERIHPEDLERLIGQRQVAGLTGGDRAEVEYRIRHRDGHWVTVLDRSRIVPGPDGPARVVGSTVDITARKAAEAALRDSEARFRAIFENAGVGVARASLDDGRCLEVNDRVCAILGYTRGELLGLPWSAITHPDDLEADLAQFRRLAAGEIEGYSLEKRYLRKDGEVVWVRLTLSLARDSEGRPDFEIAIMEDIGERRAAEQALRESEELNRRILAASPDCIMILSLDARLEFFSDGGICAMEVEDFDRELKGADWLTFWRPEDRPLVRAAIDAALGGGTGRFQAFCPTARGTPKWWDVSVTAIADPDGAPERLLSVSRDVTEARRGAERMALLADAAARLLVARDPSLLIREIFGLIAGPLRLDACFNYRLTESGGLELAAHAGLSAEAAGAGARLEMGQAVCGLVARDRRPVHVGDVQASDDPQHAFIKAQGITAYACTPLLVGDRLLGTLGFGRRAGLRFEEDELTFLRTVCHYVAMALERLRAEAELLRLNAGLEARVAERTASLKRAARALEAEMARREAAQAQLLQTQKMEALGQVVGGVAHDFNNILAAIQGSFEVLDRRLDDPRLRQAVEQGQGAAERAAALIRQMLAFARREPIVPRAVDLAAIFDGIEGMVCHSVGRNVACRFAAEPGTWPVLADPHQLEVSLLNLAVNARDAMPGGGTLTIRARNLRPGEARPEALGPGDHVLLTVADTGSGMDEATRARVLEPFFTTKEAGQGTGLGLAQVQGFVAAAGGAIAIESAPGQGTTLSIHLPRAMPD